MRLFKGPASGFENGRLKAFRSATARFLPYILSACDKMIGPWPFCTSRINQTLIPITAYEAFCDLIKSYQAIRLSKSNWAINTEEPPRAVWQKLKRHIKAYDYVIMFPLDARLLTANDKKILQWILARP